MVTWSAQIRRLRQLLRRRGRTREDAEDLVQEAFLRLHIFLNAGHEVRRPEPFLMRTALNLSVDQNRREQREGPHVESIEELVLADAGPTPEDILAVERRLQQIRETLEQKVSARTREVFYLHRLEGFTHEEIASRMNLSLRMVEKHIARAITVIWMERSRE
jgi:RNA polymerase sigma-70 factor (ECF subfamily)